MRQVHIISAEEFPQPLNVVGETVTVLAAGDASKPFEVHIQEGRAGGGPPPHFHPWDEAFYILEGVVELTVEDSIAVLSAGSYVHIPANTMHAYRNVSQTAKLLAVVSDCRGGEAFAAIDERVHSMPDDLPKLLDAGSRFGIVFESPDGSL